MIVCQHLLSSVIRRLSSDLAPVAGIEPAYSPLNRRRRAPCSALTGMVENRGNAPRTTCLQDEPDPLLVSHGAEGWSRTTRARFFKPPLYRELLRL